QVSPGEVCGGWIVCLSTKTNTKTALFGVLNPALLRVTPRNNTSPALLRALAVRSNFPATWKGPPAFWRGAHCVPRRTKSKSTRQA
ncbi:unnamed protein product, partial [Ectocarpus sp. 12 AP-2014]